MCPNQRGQAGLLFLQEFLKQTVNHVLASLTAPAPMNMQAIPNRPRGKGLQQALRCHLAAVGVAAYIVHAGFNNQPKVFQPPTSFTFALKAFPSCRERPGQV